MLDTVASQYLSNGGHICCFRVESRLSFLDLFLRSSRESNEPFLGAASVISRPFIFQVSIAGKHFSIKTSLKFMLSRKCLLSTSARHTCTMFWSFAGGQGSELWIIFA